MAAGRLIDVLWGDSPPPSAESTLRSLVSRLRRTLEASGGTVSLQGTATGYRLAAPESLVDARQFDQLVAAGRDGLARGDHGRAAETLGQALALCRGPAFEEFAGHDFARPEAARLDEAQLDAVEDLCEAFLALGRAGDAVARLELHLAEHPLRERAWGQLMLALYRLGRQAEALRAYSQVRKLLAEELGIDPNPGLRRLEEDILHQGPELDALSESRRAPTGPISGTVVFLFTDIEASTRRWEGDQEAMTGDLARHDDLLLDAFEAAGAHVFSHTGDGLCAAFATVGAALGAAVAAQRALLGSHWKAPQPLRVRMAIHVGGAEARGGTYLGPTLNRTARLLATTWGTQIVCSQAVADLARDELPGGVSLLDLAKPSAALVTEVVNRAASPGYDEWWAKVADSGFCAAPVRLVRADFVEQSAVLARCKNRRASVCPSCSQLYAGDTWRLVHAGMAGDEESVAVIDGHPMVFATLTAPSFGAVHSANRDPLGRPGRCRPGRDLRWCRHGRPAGCR